MKLQELIQAPEFAPRTEAEAILAAISCLAEHESFERLKFTRHKKPRIRKEDKVMTAIYKIAHAYTSSCGCHDDWKSEGVELAKAFGVPWPVNQEQDK